ncbi:aquaporin AQPAe.a-like [Dreissena polymorpha]|uniref:Aquaporin n=1 Tax=Dreissena polymorpha TaxID=45954 RepID=A0A9D3YKC7_DREPO|nr:aquaporin AQPAe.a-like [Dreissena polymorpha]KAH3701586.1 hypothetical protein DPMN_076574 [Dreissena polymorpha]
MATTEQPDFNETYNGLLGIFKREIIDFKSLNFWRALFSEFVGTFIACFYTISFGLYDPDNEKLPDSIVLAVGTSFIVAALGNTLANVSGGHINPSVSLGFLVDGQITVLRFIFYSISQCSASVVAVLLVKKLTPQDLHGNLGLHIPGSDVTPVQALLVEFLITFVLLFGTFAFIDKNRTDVTSPAALYVGLIAGANTLCARRISGGCMNPARNFGPAIVTGKMSQQWIYWVGCLLGAVAGTMTYTQLFSAKVISSNTVAMCRRRPTVCEQAKTDAELEKLINTRQRVVNRSLNI